MTKRLRRVTDLFTEGRTVELGKDPDGQSILVWIHKLNSYEEDEARHDGLSARQARIAELKGDGNDGELAAVHSQYEQMTTSALVQTILDRNVEEDRAEAIDDVESLPSWQDRLDLVRRSEELLADAGDTNSSRAKAVKKAVKDYNEAVEKAMKEKREERREDLKAESREDLIAQLVQSSIDVVSAAAFFKERQISEIWYALRDCQAVRSEETLEYDHRECTHPLLLESRGEVRTLPEKVISTVREILFEMSVPDREAGNLEGPSSSSESSAPQEPAEDSSQSSPEETPAEPVETLLLP